MTETIDIKQYVEELSENLKRQVTDIDYIKPSKPVSEAEFYTMTENIQNYLEQAVSVYDDIYKVSNLLEDYIRSVYLFMDDATLEGYATEMETQLAQLRLLGDGIRELPSAYNEEVGDMLNKFISSVDTLLDTHNNNVKGTPVPISDFSPSGHYEQMKKIMLYNSSYLKALETISAYKETCVKLLSILAMVIGKWEKKLEDRVDMNRMNEGLVMSSGKSVTSKRKIKKRDTGLYN